MTEKISKQVLMILTLWLLPSLALYAEIAVTPASPEEARHIESILQTERSRAAQMTEEDSAEDIGIEAESEDGEDDEDDHESEAGRRYITREERRDEGHRYEFGEWLSLAGIAEAEYERETLTNHEDSQRERTSLSPWSLETVVELTPLDWLAAEIVYEYDSELDDFELDEAILALEYGDFELEAGKFFVPFGEYFSHFVAGPIIEFAETRGDRAAQLSYGPSDNFDLAVFVYRGLASKIGRRGQEYNWGFALELVPVEFATLGLSYLSDLADAEDMLLEDEDNRYRNRVDALSGYVLFGFEAIEFSAEFVHALDSFIELDKDRNDPLAWNTELAWFPFDPLGFALRFEGSRQIEDEPRSRSGIAVMWQVVPRVFLTVDYLQGSFKRGLAEDDQEREAKRQQLFGAQLSIEL